MEYKFVEEFLKNREDVIAAFGYGSAFFRQSGYKSNTKVTYDLILVVSDIKKWHKKNYKLNPSDYSLSSKIYLTHFPKILIKGKTKMSYNAEIEEEGKKFKYGVIELSDFYECLNEWKSFYICGRMQKSIYSIKSCEGIDKLIKKNREKALLTSLLILNKPIITVEELLEQICKLSYYGDIRTLLVENPNKVRNIVKGSLNLLKDIYLDNKYLYVIDNNIVVNLKQIENNYDLLPNLIKKKIKLSNSDINSKKIINILKHKNLIESIEQPIKGLITNGAKKSIEYVLTKKSKNKLK